MERKHKIMKFYYLDVFQNHLLVKHISVFVLLVI